MGGACRSGAAKLVQFIRGEDTAKSEKKQLIDPNKTFIDIENIRSAFVWVV